MNTAARDPLTDVLERPELARKLYRLPYHSAQDRAQAVGEAAARGVTQAVVDELALQNSGGPPAVTEALRKTSQRGWVAVVTGQQLGFCGGPLLTLYKILTAIKFARMLEAETGTPTVPIFWIQSEDHDFEEIREAQFLGPADALSTIGVSAPESLLGRPVAEFQIGQEYQQQIAQLLKQLAPVDQTVAALLTDAYQPGQNFAVAYQRLIQGLLGRFGLLVLNPHTATLKIAVKDFIASCFFRSRPISRLLLERNKWLTEQDFPTPVHVREDSPLFFYTANGKRVRLTESPDGIWSGPGVSLTKEQLYLELDASPLAFTSSALIRPLFQDLLLPTAAYIAGPTEFNYWAQIKPLYEFFKIPEPLVVPRARLQIADARTARNLTKLELTPDDLAQGREAAIRQVLGRTPDAPEQVFRTVTEVLTKLAEQLKPQLLAVDQNLAGPLSQTIESSLSNFNRLRGKYERALAQKNETLTEQISGLERVLLPGGKPQDRMISMLHFPLKFGVEFIDQLFEMIDPLQDKSDMVFTLPLGGKELSS